MTNHIQMYIKKDNISVVVEATKKVPDIIIALSIPIKDISDCCLYSLKHNCHDTSATYSGSQHEAAVAYAIYKHIRDKLNGSALELLKTKASNINCYVTNGEFTVSWNTQGSITSLRKTTGIALSCLNVYKLFPKYTENIKFLSSKGGDREVFKSVCGKVSKDIIKSVKIVVVGKINAKQEALSALIETIAKKFPKSELSVAAKGSIPKSVAPKTDESDKTELTVIKCSGLDAGLAADYIRNNTSLVSVCVSGEGVVLPIKDLSKIKKLQDNA